MKNIAQKLCAMFVLALFVVSVVPLALAQEVNQTQDEVTQYEETKEVTREDNEDKKKQFRRVLRANQGERAQDRVRQVQGQNEERKETVQNRVDAIKDQAQEHRADVLNTAHTQRKKLHNSLTKARNHYQDRKENLREHKQDLQDKRSKLVACQKDNEVCDKERKDIKRGVVNQGRNNIDFIIAAFEKIKHRIDEAEDISDSDTETIFAMIDSKLASLEDAKAQFDALGDDATADEIRSATQNLKQVWHDMKPTYKWAVEIVLASKLESTVDHFETSHDRLAEKITALEAQGHDMSDANNLLAELKTVLGDADVSIDSAQETLSSLETDASAEEITATVRDAHNQLKDVRGTFNEAKKLLREIFNFIKDARVDTSVDTATEDQAEA